MLCKILTFNRNFFYVLLHINVEFLVFKLFYGHIFKAVESHPPDTSSHEEEDTPKKRRSTKRPSRKRKTSKADVSLSQNSNQ